MTMRNYGMGAKRDKQGEKSGREATSSRLLRKVHPPKQVLKSRIGTHGIKTRPHFQQRQPNIALLVPSFQPSHGLVLVAEGNVHFRHPSRPQVGFFFVETPRGFVKPSPRFRRISSGGIDGGNVETLLQILLLEAEDCRIEFALRFIDKTEAVKSQRIVRI